MRCRYHGSIIKAHGLGTLVGYLESDHYYGAWRIELDSGGTLEFVRRESFTLLDDDDDDSVSSVDKVPAHV